MHKHQWDFLWYDILDLFLERTHWKIKKMRKIDNKSNKIKEWGWNSRVTREPVTKQE